MTDDIVNTPPLAVVTDNLKRKRNDCELVCNICSKSEIKYRCPGCLRMTCSLNCCLAHKKKYECNGKRDRTKFLKVSEFKDSDLLSDYFLLEEISQSADIANRKRAAISGESGVIHKDGKKKRRGKKKITDDVNSEVVNPELPSSWLNNYPKSCQALVRQARKAGVNLNLLSLGMSKRESNTSYFEFSSKTLFWKVEWIFPNAEVKVILKDDRVDDKKILGDVLNLHIEPHPSNAILRGKLKNYCKAEIKEWLVLLRKEFISSSVPQYYELNLEKSLNDNLKRKVIIEFPTIVVALKTDREKYVIVHDSIEETITNSIKCQDKVANNQHHPISDKKEVSPVVSTDLSNEL